MPARPFDSEAALLYGKFVQAAYTMYNSAPHDVTPLPSADFPADYRMVAWIQMQDFVLESTAPLFYGFIAESKATIGQLVVALRGTSNGVEWWDDFNALETTVFKNPDWGRVGAGFDRIYDTLEVIECPAEAPPAPTLALAAPRSMRPAGSFAQQIQALMIRRGAVRTPARRSRAARAVAPPNASVEVTGHSLGAALATLYAMENAKTAQIANPMLCTFASPLVGDATFAATFDALGLTSWRIANVKDLVTKISARDPGLRSRRQGGAGRLHRQGRAERWLLARARDLSQPDRSERAARRRVPIAAGCRRRCSTGCLTCIGRSCSRIWRRSDDQTICDRYQSRQ